MKRFLLLTLLLSAGCAKLAGLDKLKPAPHDDDSSGGSGGMGEMGGMGGVASGGGSLGGETSSGGGVAANFCDTVEPTTVPYSISENFEGIAVGNVDDVVLAQDVYCDGEDDCAEVKYTPVGGNTSEWGGVMLGGLGNAARLCVKGAVRVDFEVRGTPGQVLSVGYDEGWVDSVTISDVWTSHSVPVANWPDPDEDGVRDHLTLAATNSGVQVQFAVRSVTYR